jgi:hypothetical protein
MLSFAIRLKVNCPRFTIVRLDFAQGLSPRMRALLVFGMSVMAASAATALPLTPFRYEAQAQRYCPGDTVVWLDFRKGVYYFKRQKRYGQGATGSFVCQKEARASGFRRSLLGVR